MRSNLSFARVLLAAAILAGGVSLATTRAGAAETAPNTSIQNTASATYKDSSGTSYTTESNTVTTVVQNAPVLTVTTNNGSSAGTQTVAPGQVVSDTYTLTNTGNAAGNFQLTTGASDNGVVGSGNDNGNTSSVAYIYNATTYTSVSALNTALSAATATVVNGTVSIQIQYTLSATPTNVPGAVTTQLKATISYPVSGGAVAETSAAASNTYTDSVQSDARLDLQKSSAQAGTAPYAITYTIKANDGGNFSAKPLSSVTAMGFPSAGCIVIADKVPTYGAASPVINGTPSVTATAGTNGFPSSGATATIYYTTSANGSSGWTTTEPANPAWIAVFVASASACLNSNPGSSAGSVPSPAVALTFVVPQPSGAGSGNPNAYSNIANGVIGDNQPTEHILGPGIPAGTADSGGAGPIYASGQGINNTTSEASPQGASQIVYNNAHASAGVFNGPSSSTPLTMSTLITTSQATGDYSGSAGVSNNNDFTQASLTPSSFTSINSGTTPGTPNGNTYSSTATVNVPNALYNSGNLNDSYTLVATAPSGGWTVQLYPDNGSGTGPGATAYAGCTTAAATCTATVAVNSGSAIQYWAVYVSPSGAQSFVRNDASIVATSVTDNTQVNTTHNEIYTGFIVLTKSANVTSTNCPAGATPTLPSSDATGAKVCPGGTIQYSIDYRNIAGTGGTGNTEPSNAFLATQAGSLVITDDGTAIGNTWAANTNGLTAPATDTPNSGGTWNTNDVTKSGNTTGASSLSIQIGGASFQLAQGQYGTLAFSVVVK